VVLQDMEQDEAAIEAYRRALALDATSALARQNLGNALRSLGRLEEAESQYSALLQMQPLQADAAAQLGATRLSRGDYSAWAEYEWRYWSPESLATSPPWPLPLPKWDGCDLAGRTLHLYGEQGIGDEIMFASVVPDIARVATVKLWCEPRLATLFARSFPGIEVFAKPRGGLAPLLDAEANDALRCPLASLPRFARRVPGDFTGAPYLRADADATARWHERFAAMGGRLTIGISWRGGGSPRAREARSIALERLEPLFALDAVRIVDLQYGEHREEIDRFNAGSTNAWRGSKSWTRCATWMASPPRSRRWMPWSASTIPPRTWPARWACRRCCCCLSRPTGAGCAAAGRRPGMDRSSCCGNSNPARARGRKSCSVPRDAWHRSGSTRPATPRVAPAARSTPRTRQPRPGQPTCCC